MNPPTPRSPPGEVLKAEGLDEALVVDVKLNSELLGEDAGIPKRNPVVGAVPLFLSEGVPKVNSCPELGVDESPVPNLKAPAAASFFGSAAFCFAASVS